MSSQLTTRWSSERSSGYWKTPDKCWNINSRFIEVEFCVTTHPLRTMMERGVLALLVRYSLSVLSSVELNQQLLQFCSWKRRAQSWSPQLSWMTIRSRFLLQLSLHSLALKDFYDWKKSKNKYESLNFIPVYWIFVSNEFTWPAQLIVLTLKLPCNKE